MLKILIAVFLISGFAHASNLTLKHSFDVGCFATLSPNQKYLLSSGCSRADESMILRNIDTGVVVNKFGKDMYDSKLVAFHPNGNIVAEVAGPLGPTGNINPVLTEYSNFGKNIVKETPVSGITSLAISVNGQTCKAVVDGIVYCEGLNSGFSWQMATVLDIKFSPINAGQLLLNVQGSFRIVSIETGRAKEMFGIKAKNFARFVRNGANIITGDKYGSIAFYNSQSGEIEKSLKVSNFPIYDADLSTDGQYLVFSDDSYNISLYDLNLDHVIATIPWRHNSSTNFKVSFIKNDMMILVSGGYLTEVWDLKL